MGSGIFDNVAGAYNATKAMIQEGCRDIGIITGDLNTKTARDRYQGYLRALEENSIPVEQKKVYQGDFTTQTAYEMRKKILQSGITQKHFFTTNNLTTIGFIKAVYDSKLELGKDINCISFDKLDTFEELKYSYIERDPMKMGNLAATMLMERVKDPELPARKYYMPSTIKIDIP